MYFSKILFAERLVIYPVVFVRDQGYRNYFLVPVILHSPNIILAVAETLLKGPACLKATVENPRGSFEKLSPSKESVEGDDTVLRGSVRAGSFTGLNLWTKL